MSTIKSSAEDLTLNADGSGNDIKFQSNAVEKASLSDAGLLTTSGGASLDGVVTINETGADVDFRVEGSGEANALFVQGSDGAVGIGTGSPAKPLDVVGDIRTSTGILFGTDTAAANTLDDYEEGTWTPTVDSGTMSGAAGTYTKIGNMVTINFSLGNFSDKTTNSNIYVQSFPFATATAGAIIGFGQIYQVDDHTHGVALQSSGEMVDLSNPSSHTKIQYDDLGGDPNMNFTAVYKT
jgi:hypothetical protein